jgi:outer membrane protein TolC
MKIKTLFLLLILALPLAAQDTAKIPVLNMAREIPQSAPQDNVLTLESAIQRALERNEQSLAADETYAEYSALVAEARAYFLPQITATGVYTRRPFQVVREFQGSQIAVQRYNALSGSINLNMTLFDPYNIPNYRGARSAQAAQMYASAEAKRQLAFEVGNAYLTALGVDQVLLASEHRYEYAKQSLDAARARYKGGLVGVNDVTRSELEFATAEMGVTQIKGQVQTIYLQLGHLLDDRDMLQKKLEVPEFLLKAAEEVSPAVDQSISEAQDRRLDLNSLRWTASSQHALALTPTLKWLPALTLTGQYRYTNESGLTGRSTNWNVGATLTWSLFDGFLRNGQYSEMKALAKLSDLNVQASMRQVELQVREGLVSLENQRAALKQAVVAYDAAKRNATEIAELYRQGLASALEAADANVSMYEAEVTLIRERYGLAIAYLNVEAALGLDPFGKEPKL